MKKNLLLLSVLFFGLSLCAGETFVKTEKRKKVIKHGWDSPSPEFFHKNIKMLDTHLPFDGMDITLNRFIATPDGKKRQLNNLSFSNVRFQEAWFKKDMEHLRKGYEKSSHLKHNFIACYSTNFMGEFNFYDDKFWDNVCNNYRILAKVAKEGKCKGLSLDLEDYGGYHNWAYSPASGYSWREAWQIARKRGRQWMKSIAGEYPDITLFFVFFLDLAMGPADGTPFLFERLEGSKNGLLVAFINGIYDELPPKAKIVDGMEEHGYGAYHLPSYHRLRADRETRFQRLIADENQEKFRRQTSLAIATYLSCYTNEKRPYFFKPHMEREKMTPTEFFRRNFALAVDHSDEYTWIYNESRKWYPIKYPFSWMKNSLKKDKNVPGPYVGMAIPGIEEAIKFGRDPYSYAQEFLKKPSKKNMLKNASFEGNAGEKAVVTAADSLLLKSLPNWENWKPKRSKVKFSLAKNQGITGHAVMVTGGKGSGVTHQGVKVEPQGAYIVRACVKINGKAHGNLGIQWRNAKGIWCNNLLFLSAPFTEDLGNNWKRATLLVRSIPENTAYLNVMLNSTLYEENAKVLFDNIEVYSLFDKKEKVAPHLQKEMEKWLKIRQGVKEAARAVKSGEIKGNIVANGTFSKVGDLVSNIQIPEGKLYQKRFASWKEKKSKAEFFTLIGKNAGAKDDTCAVISGGKGSILMDSSKKIKGGTSYLFRAKAKWFGSSKPIFNVYWRSPKMKGPFDLALGIVKIPFTQKAENGYYTAEKVITVPARANAFTILLSSSAGKTRSDKVFFDDVEVLAR